MKSKNGVGIFDIVLITLFPGFFRLALLAFMRASFIFEKAARLKKKCWHKMQPSSPALKVSAQSKAAIYSEMALWRMDKKRRKEESFTISRRKVNKISKLAFHSQGMTGHKRVANLVFFANSFPLHHSAKWKHSNVEVSIHLTEKQGKANYIVVFLFWSYVLNKKQFILGFKSPLGREGNAMQCFFMLALHVACFYLHFSVRSLNLPFLQMVI